MTASVKGARKEPLALMAAKVIMLADLPSSAKAVAAVLIDHVNWQDFRCDPSHGRIARFTHHSRSNIQAGIDRMVEAGLLSVRVHGGRSGRNQYDFHWEEIRRRDAAREALRTGRRPPSDQGVPGPAGGAQTRTTNPLNEPVAVEPSDRAARPIFQRSDRQAERRVDEGRRSIRSGTDRSEAALNAAERRWGDQLLRELRPRPGQYEAAVQAIDEQLRAEMTQAELERRGAGVPFLLRRLRDRAFGAAGRPSPFASTPATEPKDG